MKSASSRFLLSMYRAARRLRHPAFRDWMFAELAHYVRFDSGFWLRTTISPSGPVMHDQYLYRQRPDRLTAYLEEGLWTEDSLMAGAMEQPWSTVVMRASDVPSSRLRDFLARHEQAHALAAGAVSPVTRVVTGLAVFRREAADPFQAADRDLFEMIGPHMMDAWNYNWLQYVGAQINPMTSGYARAIVTRSWMIETADDQFEARMRVEWPDWVCPVLPDPLLDHLADPAAPHFFGRRTVAKFEHVREADLILIGLRERHVLDQLSPRKRAVARLFATGASQQEISTRLALAPSTVNNYLADIYRQLGVDDKARLAILVVGLPE